MKKCMMFVFTILLLIIFSSPGSAKTLRWAFQGDAQALDPHVLNETFTLGLLGNIYEGLVRRSPELKIIPHWQRIGRSKNQLDGDLSFARCHFPQWQFFHS